MMRVFLVLMASWLFAPVVMGASSTYPLDPMAPDLNDKASLQRGLQTFMNYCFGCHSLQYQRYKRTAEDLGIPEDLMLEHIVFDPDVRIGELMKNAMSPDASKNWFGAPPPDLTLHTQLKGGPDWLYTYMRTFYIDESRPFGVNNLVFENVGMPHVLMDLQGIQRKGCRQIPKLAKNGGEMMDPLTHEYITEEKCGQDLLDRGYAPLALEEGSGKLSPEEYDQVIYDLTNFLYYTGDPSRQDRERIGVYVILFLAFFYVFARLLGREYEKEYH